MGRVSSLNGNAIHQRPLIRRFEPGLNINSILSFNLFHYIWILLYAFFYTTIITVGITTPNKTSTRPSRKNNKDLLQPMRTACKGN